MVFTEAASWAEPAPSESDAGRVADVFVGAGVCEGVAVRLGGSRRALRVKRHRPRRGLRRPRLRRALGPQMRTHETGRAHQRSAGGRGGHRPAVKACA